MAITILNNTFVNTKFSVNDKTYLLQPLGNNGAHALAEINPNAPVSVCGVGDNIIAEDNGNNPPMPSGFAPCEGRTIRILVLATPDIIGQSSSIATDMIVQVRDANTVFQRSMEWVYDDSRVVNVELANTMPIEWDPKSGYINGKTFNTEQDFLRYIAANDLPNALVVEGQTDRIKELLDGNANVRALREQYKADVTVVVHKNQILAPTALDGLASQISGLRLSRNTAPNDRDNSFVLLFNGKLSSRYLLVHELGHLLGGHHFEVASTYPNTGARFGFGFNHVAPSNQRFNIFTIMYRSPGEITVPVFSSPSLLYPGVSYAVLDDDTRLRTGTELLSGVNSPKDLAIHSPSLPQQYFQAFTNYNPIQIGTNNLYNVASFVDRYAESIAAYRLTTGNRGVRAEIRNMPRSLARGESATIEFVFTGCSGNNHNYRIYFWTATQRMGTIEGSFTGSQYRFTHTITMPNDVSHGLNFYRVAAMIETSTIPGCIGCDVGFANYSSASANAFAPCTNCYPASSMNKAALLTAQSHKFKREYSQGKEIEQANLLQNVPNPVREGKTEIAFTLEKDAYCVITLFNSLGQEVQKILQERRVQGSHTLSVDVVTLPNGVYSYRLQADQKSITRRLIIAR